MARKRSKVSLKAQLEAAERKGREEGHAEGLAEGHAEGRKEGMDDVLAALKAADPWKLAQDWYHSRKFRDEGDYLETRLDSAMLEAVKQNQPDVVVSLIKAGADVHACYKPDKLTALHCAVKEGHIEMVQALLKAGANPNYTDNTDEVLFYAVRQGDATIIKALLAAGADIHRGSQPEYSGWMIDYDAEGDQVELTRILLDAGAYIGPYSDDEWTALMFAARSGKAKAAAVLIEAGCDVNAVHFGTTALMLASQCIKEGALDTIQLLLKSGAEINYKKNNEHTALISAARTGRPEAVSLLLSAGADVFYRAQEVQARYGLRIKAGNAYDLAEDEAVKDILKSEMHRRIAAALSVLHPAMPVEVRQTIIQSYLEQ